MDAARFDALTLALTRAASSRRRLLTGVVGSSLGAIVAALGFEGTNATHFGCVDVGERCKRNRKCCSGRCKGRTGKKTCRAHGVGGCTAANHYCTSGTLGCGSGNCYCFQTTGGANFCTKGGPCIECTKNAQCEAATGVRGSACVQYKGGFCNNCSSSITTLCAAPCDF